MRAMSELLTPEAIDEAVAGSGWVRQGDAIVLDTEHANFEAAWAFATLVAEAAEAANHHPDILAHGWNKVRITLSTHSAGGVTDLDIDLAGAINAFRG